MFRGAVEVPRSELGSRVRNPERRLCRDWPIRQAPMCLTPLISLILVQVHIIS